MITEDPSTETFQYSADVGYGLAGVELQVEVLRFKQAFKGDFFTACFNFTIKLALVDVVDAFRAEIKETTTLIYTAGSKVLIKGENVLVTIHDGSREDDPWEVCNRSVYMTAHGERSAVREMLNFAQSFPKLLNPRIFWNYIAESKRQETTVFLQVPRSAPDSFYPYLRGGMESYIKDYMASSASVLLLRGEPGTGKTSFIQTLIWAMNSDCMITYEEQLFRSDEMFVAFLTSDTTNLLVMEDADALLLTREKHGNQTMAKFLNVSDGLIRFANKKVVISSNLVDDDRIDAALLRPGRCFDAPMFRKLTYAETLVACEDAGKEAPTDQRDYSLAEILNGAAKPRVNNVFGFTAAR